MNAIHARSQLRYSPTSVNLKIRKNPCETAVMLTRSSGDSQEIGRGRVVVCSVFVVDALPIVMKNMLCEAGRGLPEKTRVMRLTNNRVTPTMAPRLWLWVQGSFFGSMAGDGKSRGDRGAVG